MREEEEKINNGEDRKEVFSSRVRAGSRTYYFDVKKNTKDDNYLVISESKRMKDDNEKQRHRIMVFEEDIEKFSHSFFQVISYFLENSAKVDGKELEKFTDSFNEILDQLKTLTRHSSIY